MASDPLIGATIGGCEILEVIGQGGMGVIYKSRQKSLDRIIALKVLARHLASDINFVTRFQKEARAIARVNHPNILAVYDVGEDKNVNYMIMELIEGRSLAELQSDRKGAIPWEEATDYSRQSAQGLEAAQAVGIIHRDIKPENLMVTKKNVVKVSDFGLAKESDASNTSVDAVMGTPAFMSPEQCDGKKVDGRSDIYSLGGTFYRLVSGRLPFEAETAMSMMYRHKHEALIPPHEVVPTVPQSISAVIVKMMAKKREQRYQTMTEVIDAIDNARKAASPNQ
jgi:serine/threonine protein kinase